MVKIPLKWITPKIVRSKHYVVDYSSLTSDGTWPLLFALFMVIFLVAWAISAVPMTGLYIGLFITSILFTYIKYASPNENTIRREMEIICRMGEKWYLQNFPNDKLYEAYLDSVYGSFENLPPPHWENGIKGRYLKSSS